MNRFNEIEKFLDFFKRIYRDNPQLEIRDDTFNNRLMIYGLTNDEIVKLSISNVNATIKNDYFERWKNDFVNNSNLNVYYDKRQERFLQFSNCSGTRAEYYKLYLSFSEDKMYQCVKRIFQFIANNKIETFSKVADCVRSDSVILRIVKKDDAKRVIDFINNDQLISSSCKPVNPFLQQSGKVGMAYDRWMSYNCMLSFILKKYFTDKRITSSFDSVSLNDFRGYVARIYSDIFNYREVMNQFMSEGYVSREIDRLVKSNKMSKQEVLSNIKDILDLMIVNLDPSKTVGNYFQKVQNYMDPNYQKNNIVSINRIMNEAYGAFVDACNATLEKYGINQLYGALFEGLHGYFKSFTNAGSNSYRINLVRNCSQEEYNKYANEKIDEIKQEAYRVFDNIVSATLNEYGKSGLIKALEEGNKGNYDLFYGNTDELIKKCPRQLYLEYTMKLLNKIDDRRHEELNSRGR